MSTRTNNDTSLPSPIPLSNSGSSDKLSISDVKLEKQDEQEQQHEQDQDDTPRVPEYEVRVYGLNHAITAENLINFFSATTRVLGVLLHPQSTSATALQWAQVWVGSEREVERCMGLKQQLAPAGITLSKAPASGQPPTINGLMTPEFSSSNLAIDLRSPITPPSFPRALRPDISGLGYRHIDPQGPLPRNLYVMGLPLDLTQMQFKSLFSQFGMVEHSTLLSQLDGMGRRRGFILMSTHREATEAMQNMNGTWLEGFKLDVSWALVQRDTKNFGPNSFGALPNRVIHPPSAPPRRELSDDCAVLVENLDQGYFPNAGVIKDIFSTFGPVMRVTVISANPFQTVIHFEHEVSATALLNANGLSLGNRPVITSRYIKPTLSLSTLSMNRELPPPGRLAFDPFGTDIPTRPSRHQLLESNGSSSNKSLNANSAPFIPIPYGNAGWLSSENDENSNPRYAERTKTAYDGYSNSNSSNNSHSDSTKVSSSGNTNGNLLGSKNTFNSNIGMTGQNASSWPLPSETVSAPAGSRWNSAPK